MTQSADLLGPLPHPSVWEKISIAFLIITFGLCLLSAGLFVSGIGGLFTALPFVLFLIAVIAEHQFVLPERRSRKQFLQMRDLLEQDLVFQSLQGKTTTPELQALLEKRAKCLLCLKKASDLQRPYLELVFAQNTGAILKV